LKGTNVEITFYYLMWKVRMRISCNVFNFACALSVIHEPNDTQNLRAGLQALTKLYTLHDLSVKSNGDENCPNYAGSIPVIMGIICTPVCRIY